jgi:hypothetical protein
MKRNKIIGRECNHGSIFRSIVLSQGSSETSKCYGVDEGFLRRKKSLGVR